MNSEWSIGIDPLDGKVDIMHLCAEHLREKHLLGGPVEAVAEGNDDLIYRCPCGAWVPARLLGPAVVALQRQLKGAPGTREERV